MEDHVGVPGARIKIKVGYSGDLVHVLYSHVEFARLNPISSDQVLSLFVFVIWTSLGPLPQWVPGPTTRWAPGTTRLVPHGT
jgi:hypothetical protein